MNCIRNVAALVLGSLSVCGVMSASGAVEVPQDVAPAIDLGSLTDGPNYHITAAVRSDGLMRIFIIDSSYGQFQVNGVGLTKVFIQELKAVDALEKMSKSDIFVKSLGKAASAPLRYGADLINDPGATIDRTISGVTNMFDRVSASSSQKKASRTSTTDSLLGIDSVRRQLAVELGVDPYTQFAPLSQKLTEIAQVAVAGSLSVKVAMSAIPGGVGTVVSSADSAESTRNTLREKTSAQVLQEVQATLKSLNVPANSARRIVANKIYTPADLLVMARALKRLNAANSGIFIDRAAAATSREVAFFQRQRAELLADRSRELGGIKDFVAVADFPLNRTSNGQVIAAFPFDEFSWTEINERSVRAVMTELQRNHVGTATPVFAIAKAATPMAAQEMQKSGWQVVTLK
jgi:hypothetical protein